MLTRPKSQKIYQQMCEVIPGGVNSPVRATKSMHQIPMVVESAKGDLLFDCDGHSYIDYCGSWGPLIHGHANEKILNAVRKRLEKGSTFGITTEIEGLLAEKVVSMIDSIEKIRFVSTGTEATMSAVRLARGYTQKDLIVKFSGNYHGHADFFLVEAGSGVLNISSEATSDGIPQHLVQDTLSLPFNDSKACRAVFNDPTLCNRIAAVILEPIAGNMGVVPADSSFIQFLRDETHRLGALLIFDEVMTGFRVAKKGAQEIYPITPDLTCFGKIIGGGFPAAAFGGRKEIMDLLAPLGPVYQAGTLSGNPLAMEAGLQSLILLEQPHFYEELARKTQLLIKPIRAHIEKNNLNMCIQECGSMFTLFFGRQSVKNLKEALLCHADAFAFFFRQLFEKGIYIPPSQYEAWFMSHAHTDEHINYTVETIIKILNKEFFRMS